jgi:hypothetical protein
MTHTEFETVVRGLDPTNAEYILASDEICEMVSRSYRWEQREPSFINLVDGIDREKRIDNMVERLHDEIREKIASFDKRYITPANVKVGQGVTVHLYSDSHAGTIIKVTKASITVQRDKATLDPSFKPQWIPGGFSAICTNQHEQKWDYELDPKGTVYTFRWSKKFNSYGTPGNLRASKGRREYYDYNF